MRLRAYRTRLLDNAEHQREVFIEVELLVGPEGKLVLAVVEGGVTGYESYNLDSINWSRLWALDVMTVCAGTVGKWDRLEIPVTEIARFVRRRGLDNLEGIDVPERVMRALGKSLRERLEKKLREVPDAYKVFG